jgi:hypothetical protein
MNNTELLITTAHPSERRAAVGNHCQEREMRDERVALFTSTTNIESERERKKHGND